jgi:hypothetical protein
MDWGQLDSMQRSLTHKDGCTDVLMLLADVRSGAHRFMVDAPEHLTFLHIPPGFGTMERPFIGQSR